MNLIFPKVYPHNQSIMKGLAVYPLTLALLFFSHFASAQFNLEITVNDGSSTTTCTDNFGTPDPMWSINIENQGWVTYPSNIFCYNDFPNLQFQQSYQCLTDIPPTVEVCFRAFENDASIIDPCNEVTSCLEEICVDIPVPPFGSVDFTMELPDGLSSDGEANLTIAAIGLPGGVNDLPCDALDVGVLANGTSVGMADTSIFNNFCSTNFGEPDPASFGANVYNQQGVWFTFTASSDPGTHILIEAFSDPSNFGDPMDLEIAVFTSDNDCNGTFDLISASWDNADFNQSEYIECPQPDQQYYIYIDGKGAVPGGIEGYFGLEITEMEVDAVGDFPCDALALGAVPLGGSASNTGLISNACATGINEPCVPGVFCSQAGVWLTFEAPPTGHVQIDAISNATLDDIDIQLAAYQSSDGTCSGTLDVLGASYQQGNSNESLELSCLNPGETYYILVDGADWIGTDLNGIFDIVVTDAGNETPTFTQDITLCAGETLTVGGEVYYQTGNYVDTLTLPSGCDSIVISNLIVLDELEFNFSVTNIGLNLGNTDGEASVSPSGGAGGYSVVWTNGQTTNNATGLVGGDNYCVEISDINNCVIDTCFDMPYYENFITQVNFDTLDCFGDANASINFTAELGEPPYQFDWENSTSTLTGSGAISFDGQLVSLDNLPADVYTINISDVNYDTVLQIEIIQPDLISVMSETVVDASCFSACDGSIALTITGGVPPYQYLWSNGGSSDLITNLCADDYQVIVTDINGCTGTFEYQIEEPDEFIATATEVQSVSCFQGTNGQATVSTNGTPTDFIWSNGDVTQDIIELAGGTYDVTVTNSDGCTATTFVEVVTPSAPVSVAISELEPILCNGENSGILESTVGGPGNNFTFDWSNGGDTQNASDLGAGNYAVTISNELGCTATDNYLLTEPSEITLVDFSTNSLTCNDPANGGIITVDSISGGLEPYTFSSNGMIFGTEPEITGFTAGFNVFYVEDAIGCIREFEAEIEGPQEIILDVSDDMTIDLGDFANLTSQSNILNLTYEWTPSLNATCPDCDATDVQPFESTNYTLTVTDEFDCTASAQVFVNVVKNRKVFVPNVFSPNGDGINDEFIPFLGSSVSMVNEFQIFDRQGNLVFEAYDFNNSDVTNAWDGYFRGKMMQPAVFVWYAKVAFLDGETEVFKGDVTLVR